jgi:hypothetical protein
MKQIKNTFVGGDGGIGSRRCITGNVVLATAMLVLKVCQEP